MAAFLFNPTKTCRHEARFWTVKILGRIVCAPFCYVNFADFWIADQLNSIVPAFMDMQYFFCFYTTNSNLHTVDGKFIFALSNHQLLVERKLCHRLS
jgi:xenotropic and polytropic retrovirus receptor 1